MGGRTWPCWGEKECGGILSLLTDKTSWVSRWKRDRSTGTVTIPTGDQTDQSSASHGLFLGFLGSKQGLSYGYWGRKLPRRWNIGLGEVGWFRMSSPYTVLSAAIFRATQRTYTAPPVLHVGKAISDKGNSFISPESWGSHSFVLSPLSQIGRMIKRLISWSAADSWSSPCKQCRFSFTIVTSLWKMKIIAHSEFQD